MMFTLLLILSEMRGGQKEARWAVIGPDSFTVCGAGESQRHDSSPNMTPKHPDRPLLAGCNL